jgi:hypothetical protein
MYRYCFIKDRRESTPWYHKPLNQSEAIARKHFGCSFALWNYLKKNGNLRLTTHKFNGRLWETVGEFKRI